jgi:hypothetical protein
MFGGGLRLCVMKVSNLFFCNTDEVGALVMDMGNFNLIVYFTSKLIFCR